MPAPTPIAIIGAGNGGLSFAGYLAQRGHRIRLYDRFPAAIAPVLESGGVRLVGEVLSGFAAVEAASSDLAEVVRPAEIILVVVPAFAHDYIARELASLVRPDQLVVLNPGYLGGALLFRKIWQESGAREMPLLVEAMTLLFATRLVGPACVGVRATKLSLPVAALPATRNGEALERLSELIPQVTPTENVLATGLNNPNPVAHVPTSLLNLGRFDSEEAARSFDFHDWITPEIQRVIDAVEEERLSVAKAWGVMCLSLEAFSRLCYGSQQKRPVQSEGATLASNRSVPPRYIIEDVPMGLVPLASFGQKVSVPTVAIDSLIHLASLGKGVDYRAEGRTLKSLGVADLSVEEIRILVNEGAPEEKSLKMA